MEGAASRDSRWGTVSLEAPDRVVAGSMASIRLTYTAGMFGIDDQGSLKFALRFAGDAGRPQFDRPGAPNYVTAQATNGAELALSYDQHGHVRPWFKAIVVRVVKRFLAQGDQITLTLGDRRDGSAGWRVQTLREPRFGIRAFVNPFGTGRYVEVPVGKTIDVTPGAPVAWKLILPTLRTTEQSFRLCIKAEDRCGNPTDAPHQEFTLRASRPVRRLPARVRTDRGPCVIDDLTVDTPGNVEISLLDAAGQLMGVSNPLRIVEHAHLIHYWADFHAQSEETIGTNSAHDYFVFARDRAFLDIVGHQGNDFQITNEFWHELNRLTARFNQPGRFVTLPGYEWSGVTPLGGDRNIFFAEEGRPIRRSSHALVDDTSDIDSDCNHAADLFRTLRDAGERCVAFAHVGGRYADLRVAHDGTIEKSVEIHSAWGTFEWLLFDAFELGHRVGIVCNSDDHKGRPGASHPGASIFGAYGGLTCLWLPSLTREAVLDCLRTRRHYGTTGDRLYLDVRARFDGAAEIFVDDPALRPTRSEAVDEAMMGDIVRTGGAALTLKVVARSPSPIERVELRVGAQTIETLRPYTAGELGSRLRVIWEGAEYRGRGRMTTWDGELTLHGNRILQATPVNFWHLEKELTRCSDQRLTWQSVTTGNFAGVDLMLASPREGQMAIRTPHAELSLNIADIGLEDVAVDAGGLARRLRVSRLPDENPHRSFIFKREIPLRPAGDTPVYVRVTQENGHCAWSSPIYAFRG